MQQIKKGLHCDFNPRSYKRSDILSFPTFSCLVLISIHAPTRGATPAIHSVFSSTLFQSTLLQEERLAGNSPNEVKQIFQSTLLQEERPGFDFIHSLFVDFNPRSYKRSDIVFRDIHCIQKISIHAPTRGATNYLAEQYTQSQISIHAPTRGATNSSILSFEKR